MAQLTHLRRGDTVVTSVLEGVDAFTALEVVSVDKAAGTAVVRVGDREATVAVAELTVVTF